MPSNYHMALRSKQRSCQPNLVCSLLLTVYLAVSQGQFGGSAACIIMHTQALSLVSHIFSGLYTFFGDERTFRCTYGTMLSVPIKEMVGEFCILLWATTVLINTLISGISSQQSSTVCIHLSDTHFIFFLSLLCRTNPIVELFNGHSKTEGILNGQNFTNESRFGAFPVQVQGHTHLHDSLDATTYTAELNQETWFTRLPPILVLELSRFQFNQVHYFCYTYWDMHVKILLKKIRIFLIVMHCYTLSQLHGEVPQNILFLITWLCVRLVRPNCEG